MTALRTARIFSTVLAVIGTPALAYAQSSLLQGGPIAPGHVPVYVNDYSQQPIVADSGLASGGVAGAGITELGLTEQGAGLPPYANAGSGPDGTNFCDYDGPTKGATGYHYLCLGPNADGGGLLTYGAVGDVPTLPFQMVINGTTYTLPLTGSGLTFGGDPVDSLVAGTNITGTLNGTALTLSAAGSGEAGTVTSIAAGTGIAASPNPITTTGTISIAPVITAGTVGSSTSIPALTYNAEGQLTTVTTAPVIAPAGTLTGAMLAPNVITSSLTGLGVITTGMWEATPVGIPYGGTGATTVSGAFDALSPITMTGDLIVGTGTDQAGRLAIGTEGYVLTSTGTTSAWAPATGSGGGSGTVTSIMAGTGLTATPDPITTTGTIAITPVITAGTVGSSTAIPDITYNAEGQITSTTTAPVIAPAGTLTGTMLASNVVTSSLTSVGTLTTGTWEASPVGISYGGTNATTAAQAFDNLSPITTTGDLIIGNGTDSATRLPIGTSGYVLTSTGTTAAWAPGGSGGSGTGNLLNVQVFTTSGTYTPTTGTTAVIVQVVGQGGGGGGCPAVAVSNDACVAGSGSSGSYAKVYIPSGVTTETVTIGTSGAGATAGFNAGMAGSTASFGSLVSCPGGTAGAAGVTSSGTTQAVVGLLNNSPPTACVISTGTTITSQPGQPSAFSIALGGNIATSGGLYAASGLAGSGPIGTGAYGATITALATYANGRNGLGFGAGGSGGAAQGAANTATAGGNPSGGAVIVMEYGT